MGTAGEAERKTVNKKKKHKEAHWITAAPERNIYLEKTTKKNNNKKSW